MDAWTHWYRNMRAPEKNDNGTPWWYPYTPCFWYKLVNLARALLLLLLLRGVLIRGYEDRRRCRIELVSGIRGYRDYTTSAHRYDPLGTQTARLWVDERSR